MMQSQTISREQARTHYTQMLQRMELQISNLEKLKRAKTHRWNAAKALYDEHLEEFDYCPKSANESTIRAEELEYEVACSDLTTAIEDMKKQMAGVAETIKDLESVLFTPSAGGLVS